MMPGRSLILSSYRYSFQNQEIDKEFWGGAIAFEYRVEDPRLNRFFSVDPLSADYPHNSPYAFAENRLIDGVELEGLEWAPTKDKEGQTTGYTWAGYNKDGTPKAGTKESDIITKGNYQYWYSSDAKNKSGSIDIFSNEKVPVSYPQGKDNTPLYNYHINIKQVGGLTFSFGNYASNSTSRSKDFDITVTVWDKPTDNFFFNEARKMLGLGVPPTAIDAVYPEAIFLPLPKFIPRGGRSLGLLSDDVAKTFRFGRYTEEILKEPLGLSRYYDNVNAFAKGRFMLNSQSSSSFFDRMRYAIRPKWNQMNKISYWEIPAGTTIYKGRSAMQFPWFGGGKQYFIPNIKNVKRVTR